VPFPWLGSDVEGDQHFGPARHALRASTSFRDRNGS
jgi:hypothetical protein